MVRFARADGSKGSNKRQLEEPTPWTEIVSQLETNKKKRKKHQANESGENSSATDKVIQTTKKKKSIGIGEDVTELWNQKTMEKKEENPSVQNKKEKKKGAKASDPEYTITPEGKRVKVFRDGTARTWFDLPYEESETMTRYEGMWVKKTMVEELDRLKAALEGLDKKEVMRKMMKAKRKAHRELRIELIYQQKNLVSEATDGKGEAVSKEIRGKGKSFNDTKSTKKTEKRQQTYAMGGNGASNTENSMQENLNMKSVLDQESAEEIINIEEEQIDDDHICDDEDETKSLKASQGYGENQLEIKTDDGDSRIKKKNRMETGGIEIESTPQTDIKRKKKKDKVAEVVKVVEFETDNKAKKKREAQEAEMAEYQTDADYNSEVHQDESIESFAIKREEIHDDLKKVNHVSSCHEGFEENELMTNYGGYWVLRRDVEELEAIKNRELQAIYAARTDDSDTNIEKLTQKEQVVFQRAMKKRKRYYHRMLQNHMRRMGQKVDGCRKEKKKAKKEDNSDKVVKFDGFWVKKDGADRLHRLRATLYKEGLGRLEVDKLIQKERRKEEKILKNERQLVCLNCRQPGHMVSACPNLTLGGGEGQPSICYTCGSTEHTSTSCNLKKGSEKSFSFATCFICGEAGHISRQCPDNPRGLYPKGGACRGCGSVEHLAKDCPDLQNEKMESSMTVGRLKGEEIEALEYGADEIANQDTSPTCKMWNRSKVVKF